MTMTNKIVNIVFDGCEHLDFEPNYTPCVRQTMGDEDKAHLFWQRPAPYAGAPTMVQFCKLRGRLNQPYCCLSEDTAQCGKYRAKTHNVAVQESELEDGLYFNLTRRERK